MPFSRAEVNAAVGGMFEMMDREERLRRQAAETIQARLWNRYSDELVGVDEVDPDCSAICGPIFRIERAPQRWWSGRRLSAVYSET